MNSNNIEANSRTKGQEGTDWDVVITVEANEVFREVNRRRSYGHPYYYRCQVLDLKPHWSTPDKFGTWQAILAVGRSYLVGDDTPMEDYIANNKSPLSPKWQILAFRFCHQHPDKELCLANNRMAYEIYWRGEYCVFALPHHDRGGEKTWVSQDGKTKILVNLD